MVENWNLLFSCEQVNLQSVNSVRNSQRNRKFAHQF